MEILQTTMALTGTAPILVPLIMPLIIAHAKDSKAASQRPDHPISWTYITYDPSGRYTHPRMTGMHDMFLNMQAAAQMQLGQLRDLFNRNSLSPGGDFVAEIRLNGVERDMPHNPALYEQVLQTVKRFEST